MASCAYCKSLIIVGGIGSGAHRFCSDACAAKSIRLIQSQTIPDELVEGKARDIHAGPCPRCGGRGPIDIFSAYEIRSLRFISSWNTVSLISCKTCAAKKQTASLLLCLVAGWWGFPWGIVLTPVQIIRNILALSESPDRMHPSSALMNAARLILAEQEHKRECPAFEDTWFRT